MVSWFVLAALSQAQPAASAQARLEVSPADPVVSAEDTLRLRARVLDASGQPVSGAQVRFIAAGGRFEGSIDPDGLVRSGSTGTMPVTVVAQIPGQPTMTRRVEVRMVPGPAASITLDGAPSRMVTGQRVVLVPTVRSAAGDTRTDRVAWSSSNPAVIGVSADGLVEARALGRATITGRADRATVTQAVQEVASRVASLALPPSAKDARTGAVIRVRVA
ncbi:MAG: Ig-like domain-containing protein, partial [Gemmatimonadaceae bacterium]